ncbi:MAG: RDD family protein [Burkholderiales bacterium]|nr:RDD family protein [Burkholderiales bacterium]
MRKFQLKFMVTLLLAMLFVIVGLQLHPAILAILNLLLFLSLGALTQGASSNAIKMAKGFGYLLMLFGLSFFIFNVYDGKAYPLNNVVAFINGVLLAFPVIARKCIIVSDAGAVFDATSAPIPDIMAGYDNSIVSLRWLGCWLDLLVFAACIVIPDKVLGNELYKQTMFIWIGLGFSNYVIGEWLWGRSVGKLITGTVVVNAQGGRPSFLQVLTRTVLRVIEVNPVVAGGVPAGIAVISSTHKQRLGDMLANTYVIRKADLPVA